MPTEPPTELHTVSADDWRLLRTIRLAALADAPDAFGTQLADAERLTETDWRNRASGPGRTVLAIEDGEPAAMGGAGSPPGHDGTFVWGMWTRPASRGRGHAAAIVTHLLAWCDEQGADDVRLHVTEGNDAARRLYLSLGFEPTGVWEPLREGSDLRIEELRLPGSRRPR